MFLLLPYPSLSSILYLLLLSSVSLGDDTKWPTKVGVSLNPNTIINLPSERLTSIVHILSTKSSLCTSTRQSSGIIFVISVLPSVVCPYFIFLRRLSCFKHFIDTVSAGTLRFLYDCMCAQRKLRSACTSAQLIRVCCPPEDSGSLAIHRVPCEDSDQTVRMRRLIRVFAGRKSNAVL